jgi:hypothetical protein
VLLAPGRDGDSVRTARGSLSYLRTDRLLHLIAMSLAWVNRVISIALYAAIPVLFFLPSRLDKAIATGNKA